MYIEQLGEIFGYFFDQIDFNNLLKYSKEAVLVFGVLFLTLFVIKYIKRKKAVAEYIENGICLLFKFPPMSDVESKITEIIKQLYDEFYTKYGKKYYWSIEILTKKDQNHFFLYLPEEVYKQWDIKFTNGVEVEVVSNARENFMDSLEKKVMGLELELSKDFIYPYLIASSDDVNLNQILEDDEWIMFQILCRPAGEKWLGFLEKYKESIVKGKNPSFVYQGCSGGFFSVIFKFFVLIADTLTFFIHGSGVNKEFTEVKHGDIKKPDMEDKKQLIEIKRSAYAYETVIRLCTNAKSEEKGYFILDKVLNIFTAADEVRSNSFVVKEMHKSFKSSVKNYYFLGGMDKSVVDILNIEELGSILQRIL